MSSCFIVVHDVVEGKNQLTLCQRGVASNETRRKSPSIMLIQHIIKRAQHTAATY